jgi:hypothetical protein
MPTSIDLSDITHVYGLSKIRKRCKNDSLKRKCSYYYYRQATLHHHAHSRDGLFCSLIDLISQCGEQSAGKQALPVGKIIQIKER